MTTPVDVIGLLRAGKYQEVSDLFVEQLRPLAPASTLEAAWTAAVAEHGAVVAVGTPTSNRGETRIPVTFEHGRQTVVLLMKDGRLGGLRLAPESAAEPVRPWTAPSYVDTSAFDEEDVTVGSGPLAVPGTMSLPHQGHGVGVVLLTGSGAHDRDETIGRNKPFQDLAWGLASRGVAVLRFDKVTFAHAPLVDRTFTVVDEYVPSAVAAVRLLRDSVDRVFVVGHSLGGSMAPRVALAEPTVAGLVLLAGGTQPLHWAAVRQLRYLASLGPGYGSQATIDAATKQAEAVDSPDLSPDTPDAELPLGVPAAYWLSLRGYDPAATAATVDRPILVVQGGRDYQVTVDDDLPAWRNHLAGRDDVTIRVYEADNHLLFPGNGPSTPAEYEPAQHVDPNIVTDVAEWLLAQR